MGLETVLTVEGELWTTPETKSFIEWSSCSKSVLLQLTSRYGLLIVDLPQTRKSGFPTNYLLLCRDTTLLRVDHFY